MTARLRAFLDNPLSGLAPWIVMSVTAGVLPFEVAVGLSFATALAILLANTLTDGSQKALEYSDTAYFLVLGLVGLFADDDVQDWLRLWAAELSNIALVLIVLGTIVARRPFTLPYAREKVPREVWTTPRFIRANYVISWAWAAAFLIAAVAGWYGDAVIGDSDELWTGWIIPTAAMLCAVQFTLWYPRVATARAAIAEGRPTDAPPPVSELLAAMAGYLPLAGIVMLTFDAAGPWWLGVGMIIAGPVIAGRIAHERRAVREPSAP